MKMEGMDTNKISSLLEQAKAATEIADYDVAAGSYRQAANACEDAYIQYRCGESRSLLSAEKYEQVPEIVEKILLISPENSTAWYLKGSALFKLNDKEQAKISFLKAEKYEKDLSVKTTYKDWALRCDQTSEKQLNDTPSISQLANNPLTAPIVLGSSNSNKDIPVTKPKQETRMTWYQSSTFVNMDIYAKNVIKEESKVIFTENSISIHLKRSDGKDDYISEFVLAERIDTSQSSYNVSRVKVEIRLKKFTNGINWKTLDSTAKVKSAVTEAGISSKQRMDESKQRQKQWDSFTDKELKDYNEEDSSMSLFKTIYKDADEDTKRAMLKSYTESGGQVLSTNWDEVKKKKVVYEGKD